MVLDMFLGGKRLNQSSSWFRFSLEYKTVVPQDIITDLSFITFIHFNIDIIISSRPMNDCIMITTWINEVNVKKKSFLRQSSAREGNASWQSEMYKSNSFFFNAMSYKFKEGYILNSHYSHAFLSLYMSCTWSCCLWTIYEATNGRTDIQDSLDGVKALFKCVCIMAQCVHWWGSGHYDLCNKYSASNASHANDSCIKRKR